MAFSISSSGVADDSTRACSSGRATSVAFASFTAVSFLGLSLWGSATKRDLTGFGSFLVMGLIGIIVAMIVNIFLASSLMAFVVSVLGVGIFAGLIAYDTQRLKALYYQSQGNADIQNVVVVTGALSLYLDFVNLFQFLLNFLGDRR